MDETTATDPPAPGPAEERAPGPLRLRRSSTDRVLGGVAGGIGRYLGVDPVVVRVAIVLLALAGGTGFVAYLVAWVLVPADGGEPVPAGRGGSVDRETTRVAGVALLGLAALGFAFGLDWDDDLLLPILLIGGGCWLLLRKEATPTGGDVAPPPSGGDAAAWRDAISTVEEAVGERRRRHRDPVARITFALVVLLAGGLAFAIGAGADLDPRDAVAACLALAGAGMVVGAFRGGARSLFSVVVPLAVLLSVVTIVDLPLRGGIGTRVHEPTSLADLDETYRLGAGEMTIDLTGIDPAEWRNEVVDLDVSLGLGELDIRTPPDVTVEVVLELDAGDVDLFGRTADGTGIEMVEERDGAEGAGRVVLDIDAGLGEVRVR